MNIITLRHFRRVIIFIALLLLISIPLSQKKGEASTELNPYPPPPAISNSVSTSGEFTVYLPIVMKDLWYTTSYYINTYVDNSLYDLGCELGQRVYNASGNQESVAILDFGYPKYLSGEYGTILFKTGEFASTTAIGNGVKNFALGYYYCADTYSYLMIAIGTNNCGPSICYDPSVTTEHGRKWAEMVNDVNYYLEDNSMHYRITAAGASDMEVAWNTPSTTHAWVNGYDEKNHFALYSFGDAQGCPDYRTGYNTYCDNGWYQEDIWYISWGAGPSKPLPLIYATSGVNARQWYSLSAYSFDIHGVRMDIKGSVTQYQACLQMGGCNGIDNTPTAGYQQLLYTLNSDTDTAQDLQWATDMKWK